ncbi:MAG TPA: ectoine/hydroxyectoine ABC transporter substrate-binding protein EhuB [Vicinamibacterales bacterium]|nr:ectoine/hydroxyectoine ABC transporter substrate-binding protein EhuB [Vicinamibacterales bacterium]
MPSTCRRTLAVFVAAGALVTLGGLTRSNMVGDDSLARLERSGVVRIGYAVVPPYAFVAPGAVVTGESPEVARVIARRLGISRVDWVQTEFGSLIDGLEAHRFDVIAAGMFITPERAARVRFSDPSFHATDGLLVPRGNPRELHAHADAISAADVRLVVLAGSTEEHLLRSLGMPDHRLLTAPDALAARRAVETGTADGLPLSTPAIHWMMRHDRLGATEIAQPFRESELRLTSRLGYGAFAFRQADGRLRDAWNAQLRRFVGSAEHRVLVEPFGIADDSLPGGITVEEILRQP